MRAFPMATKTPFTKRPFLSPPFAGRLVVVDVLLQGRAPAAFSASY
jgi:hypothetical protein